VAEHDRVGVREAAAHALEAPSRGARVVDHRDQHALGANKARRGQAHHDRGLVDVAVHRVQRRADRRDLLEHVRADEVARVEDRVGGGEVVEARVRDRAGAAGQVRVGDDGQQHVSSRRAGRWRPAARRA
jgi:hypothetical protein